MVYDGEILPLTKVSRNEMGAYLCIATNGVPPSVSKRIILDVECKNLYNKNILIAFLKEQYYIRSILIDTFRLVSTNFYRILYVSVSPMIWVPNQLVGAPGGTDVTIDCHTEAHPRYIKQRLSSYTQRKTAGTFCQKLSKFFFLQIESHIFS